MNPISDYTRQLLISLPNGGYTLKLEGPEMAVRPGVSDVAGLREALLDAKPELLSLVAPGWGQAPARPIPLASQLPMVDPEDARLLVHHVDRQGGPAQSWRMTRANDYRHGVGIADWDICRAAAAIEVLLEQHCGKLKAKQHDERVRELVIRMRAIDECGGLPSAKSDNNPPGGPTDEAFLLVVRATGSGGCHLPLNGVVGSLVKRGMLGRAGTDDYAHYAISGAGVKWLEERQEITA